MKTILLIFALLFAHQSIAVAPYGFKGQDQTATQYSNVLKFKNRSVVKTGGINSLVEDQDNLLYNGGFEATPDLDGWTCVGDGSSLTIQSKPVSASVVISGDKTLAISCATVGGCTCTQDFSVNQQQIGRSVLLSGIVRTSSDVQGLKLTYRENGADTSVTTENVLNGIPATEAVIGSSATTIGIKLTIPYSATPLVVRVDEIKMAYGTAVTNQPALGQMIDYGPLNITATTTNPTKGTTRSVDKLKCAQIGPNLRCIAKYFQSNAGTAGSGRYDVNLPSGLRFSSSVETYNLTVLSGGYGNGDIHRAAIGHCSFSVSGGIYRGTAIATSATTFACLQYHISSNVYILWSSSYNHLGAAAYIDFDITAELDGGNSSVPTYTGRCSNKRNCKTIFTAVVDNSCNITGNDFGFFSGCSGTATKTLNFYKTLSNVPNCGASAIGGTGSTTANVSSITTSSFSTTSYAGATGNASGVTVWCELTGKDFEDAFTLQQNVALKNYVELSTGSKVESIVATFGTGNATTGCSASPCSYLSTLTAGNPVSVTRAANSVYTINFSKTYTKLICNYSIAYKFINTNNTAMECTNCSSISFQTVAYTGGPADGSGSFDCKGTY